MNHIRLDIWLIKPLGYLTASIPTMQNELSIDGTIFWRMGYTPLYATPATFLTISSEAGSWGFSKNSDTIHGLAFPLACEIGIIIREQNTGHVCNHTMAVLTKSNGLSLKRKPSFAHSLACHLNLAPGNQAAGDREGATDNWETQHSHGMYLSAGM